MVRQLRRIPSLPGTRPRRSPCHSPRCSPRSQQVGEQPPPRVVRSTAKMLCPSLPQSRGASVTSLRPPHGSSRAQVPGMGPRAKLGFVAPACISPVGTSDARCRALPRTSGSLAEAFLPPRQPQAARGLLCSRVPMPARWWEPELARSTEYFLISSDNFNTRVLCDSSSN